jgi:hypothetical protein
MVFNCGVVGFCSNTFAFGSILFLFVWFVCNNILSKRQWYDLLFELVKKNVYGFDLVRFVIGLFLFVLVPFEFVCLVRR